MDEQCRITVVGGRRSADLSVPAGVPIASYVAALATACGQEGNPVLPPAWSLGPATGSPFAPERSLGELGVLDGSVLYLRDIVQDEYADPVVYDVTERVAEVAERRLHRRWTAQARTETALAIGLAWLVAALTALAVRHQIGHISTAELAAMFGLALPATGWTAAERDWPVPPGLRAAISLSAVPLMALAAWALATRHLGHPHGLLAYLTPGGQAGAAIATGALIGAVIAYAAAPGPAGGAVLITALVGAVTATGLAAAKADGTAAVTAAAVVAFALLTIAPAASARVIAFSDRRARSRGAADPAAADPVASAVSAAATLLIVWSGLLAAVLTVTLVPMAAARSPYAAAAAGCLSLGLLMRAGGARLTSEVVPPMAAGSAGLLTLLLTGPGHLGWPSWVSPTTLLVLAAIAIGYGLRRLVRHPAPPAARRPAWLGAFGSMLGGGSAALAFAALRAFSHLIALGHHL